MPKRSASTTESKSGLAITLAALLKTPNEAAVDLLVGALDSQTAEIREAAVGVLLKRRTVWGHREILTRLPKLTAEQRAIVAANHRSLGRVVRDAILSADPRQFAVGGAIALEFNDYEMLPTLLQVAEDMANPNRELAAKHALDLTESLYHELGTTSTAPARRDPQLMRNHVLHSLEHSLVRYSQHKRPEIVEAFLMLAPREHPLLSRILGNPKDGAYLPIIDLLTHSQRGGVVRLALSFVDDPAAPSSALTVLARRCDPKFLEHFLRKLGSHPTAAANHNLRRIDTLSWAQNQPELVDSLDEVAQQGAVHLVMASGIPRTAGYKLIEHVLRHGKLAGRRAAAAALARYHGADANQLARDMMADPDPQVQAHILSQLRPRGVPGSLPMLLAMLDNPHEVVRAAARGSLEEFSFDRYLAAFEMLDEQVRQNTGPMIRKVDPSAPARLREELQALSRTRRLRAVAIAASMKLAPELETEIIERLGDDDHLVRAESAKALQQCPTENARRALLAVCHDRSVIVQEAAQQSLRHSVGKPFIVGQESYQPLVAQVQAAFLPT